MKLSGTRILNGGKAEPFEETIEVGDEPAYYSCQYVERIERIESRHRRVVVNHRLVWRDGVMLARTKNNVPGFVISPGDRVEEQR